MQWNSFLAKPWGLKFFILIIFLYMLFVSANLIAADEKEIDINTDGNGFLFKVDNLKPGDWMPRNITISNDGIQDFKYIAQIGKSESTKNLFEELELLVEKDGNTLFEGKLKDFTGFSPRELASGTSETLFFEVTMPTHLGNEFQGSTAEVEIIFLAEGIESTTTPPEDNNKGETPKEDSDAVINPEIVDKLPSTATNNFNILIIGAGLISIGCILLLLWSRKLRRQTN